MDRDEFMELVYETFADEPDNVLANGIIEAADAYVEHEKAQLSQECATSELISRQAAIDALDKQIKQCCKALGSLSLSDADKHAVKVEMASLRAYREMLENLPTAQPEPSIPLSWIEKHIEWLKSLDNEFANLVVGYISIMVEKWRDEQDETD